MFSLCSFAALEELSFVIVAFPRYLHLYLCSHLVKMQSTLVISKSKGPSESLRDIRTSLYRICGIEEK